MALEGEEQQALVLSHGNLALVEVDSRSRPEVQEQDAALMHAIGTIQICGGCARGAEEVFGTSEGATPEACVIVTRGGQLGQLLPDRWVHVWLTDQARPLVA